MSSNWPKSLTSAHSTTVVPLKRDGSVGVHTIIRLRYGAGGRATGGYVLAVPSKKYSFSW